MSTIAILADNAGIEWAVRIAGLSVLAAMTTAAVAFVYRSRFRDPFPDSAALIVGLGTVAFYLNTRFLLIAVVVENGGVVGLVPAVGNLAVFVAAGASSLGARTAGDRLGRDERFRWIGMGPALSPIVRATGRFITVALPDDIEDIEGYDPVSMEAKARLAGFTLDFPKGLTVDELERQLADRLKEKHDVGYVDVEVSEAGTVEYLALGQRAAGLGPTLPPGTAATALRADPPFSASPGDTVEIWDPEADENLGTAELRASVGGSVATIACGRAVAERIDPRRQYRLMTLRADAHPHREFAAILRRHETTMGVIDVSAESPLVGTAMGDLDGTVIAVQVDGAVETIPGRTRAIAGGDRLFVLARPETLRTLEAAHGVGIAPVDSAVDDADVDVRTALPSDPDRDED